jgi:NAD(P)-dependent dehydrogenase (short-subunit alcohol dehydrogenase family)
MSGAAEAPVAIVTGGAAGIGLAVGAALADAGMHVVAVDRDAPAAERAAASLRDRGGSAESAALDVADVAAGRRLIGSLVERHGRLDVLVNNAAVTESSLLFDVDEAEWDRLFAVNARGAFFLMQEAARVMVPRRTGRIVNVASIAGKGWGGSSSAAYAASKGAMLAMTRYASRALAADGVTVNTVCPGVTRTATFEQVARGRAEAAGRPFDAFLQDYEEQIPLRRMNTPDDIAQAVLFLSSPAGRNVTGQSLNVDGGLVFD